MRLLKNQPGTYLLKLDDAFALILESLLVTLKDNHVREKYIDALIANLEKCFSDLGIVNALATILDPQRATQAYQTPDFNSYGTTEIGIITDYFKESMQPDKLNNELTTLKHILVKDLQHIF